MADIKALTVTQCCNDQSTTIVVDDPLSSITTGNTYLFTVDIEGKIFTDCYTVLIIKDTPSPVTATLEDSYTSCESCLSGISNSIQVTDCQTKESYFIDINAFTTLPTIGNSYYVVFSLKDNIISSCVTITCFTNSTELSNLISISGSYVDCPDCLINNNPIYQVNTCLDSTPYYIGFPAGFDYTNYIVNFTDTIGDSICGTVIGISSGEESGTLISILGVSSEFGGTVTCEDCLAISNEKRIITNCLTGGTEVVWGSVFYEGSEVSNLSFQNGCYEVGELTTSAVTIPTFLNYDPQPDCPECIQCSGLIYSFSSCTNSGPLLTLDLPLGVFSTYLDGVFGPFTASTTSTNGIGASFFITVESNIIINFQTFIPGIRYQTGDIFTIDKTLFDGSEDFIFTATSVVNTGGFVSYQYEPTSVGKTTYLPFLDDCVEITGLSTDGIYGYTVFSFDLFDNCSLCESNDFFVWKTRECSTGNNFIVTLPNNSFIPGDYVKVKRGTVDFQCHELLSPYDFLTDGFLSPYKSETTTPFIDCETCNSGTLIGASIVKCGGGGQQFVSIPIDIWNTMAYNDSQLVFVTDNYGQCYILLNTCPLEPNYRTITPVSTYYNCIDCYLNNTRFPRSGGTETFLCIELCTPSGTTVTSVSVPHPVWTDGYGTAVTQLGMVVIGGPDGLNS